MNRQYFDIEMPSAFGIKGLEAPAKEMSELGQKLQECEKKIAADEQEINRIDKRIAELIEEEEKAREDRKQLMASGTDKTPELDEIILNQPQRIDRERDRAQAIKEKIVETRKERERCESLLADKPLSFYRQYYHELAAIYDKQAAKLAKTVRQLYILSERAKWPNRQRRWTELPGRGAERGALSEIPRMGNGGKYQEVPRENYRPGLSKKTSKVRPVVERFHWNLQAWQNNRELFG